MISRCSISLAAVISCCCHCVHPRVHNQPVVAPQSGCVVAPQSGVSGRVRPHMQLQTVGEHDVSAMSLDTTMRIIKSAGRSVRLLLSTSYGSLPAILLRN